MLIFNETANSIYPSAQSKETLQLFWTSNLRRSPVSCFCLSLYREKDVLELCCFHLSLPYLRSSQDLVWAVKTLEELQARLSLRLGVEPELEQFDWSVSDNMFLRIVVDISMLLLSL